MPSRNWLSGFHKLLPNPRNRRRSHRLSTNEAVHSMELLEARLLMSVANSVGLGQDLTASQSDTGHLADVDGDSDVDANDTFLIHLAKLAGSDVQIDQSKGNSPLSAANIRANIEQLAGRGDVDGDNDFDANDSFLLHLSPTFVACSNDCQPVC